MPFTFSHPFIVLPLCRRRSRFFSVTGLISGSMVLDFEFFANMRKIDYQSFHSLTGVFAFGIPAGILLCFLYHLLVRDALIEHAPGFIRSRLTPYKGTDWVIYFRKNMHLVLFSLLTGIVSHLFLDAFTHSDGYFVERISGLQSTLQVAGKELSVYDFLQLFISLIGAAIIGITFMKIPPAPGVFQRVSAREGLRYWGGMGLLFVFIMITRILVDPEHLRPIDLLIAAIGGALLSLLLVSGACRLRDRYSGRKDGRADKFA